MLTPRLESVVAEKKGEVLLAKVDIDENTDLALDYQVLLLLEQFKRKLMICWKISHCTVEVSRRITLHRTQLPRVWFCHVEKMWVGFAVKSCIALYMCVEVDFTECHFWVWKYDSYSGMAGHHFYHFNRFNLRCALFCNCWLWKIIFSTFILDPTCDIPCHRNVIDAFNCFGVEELNNNAMLCWLLMVSHRKWCTYSQKLRKFGNLVASHILITTKCPVLYFVVAVVSILCAKLISSCSKNPHTGWKMMGRKIYCYMTLFVWTFLVVVCVVHGHVRLPEPKFSTWNTSWGKLGMNWNSVVIPVNKATLFDKPFL